MGAPSSSTPNSPLHRSSTSRKNNRWGQSLQRTASVQSPNGDPGPSTRMNALHDKTRLSRGPVRGDAGVDRSTIRPSSIRSSSSPGHYASQVATSPRMSFSPLPSPSYNTFAVPSRSRRPSVVLYGPTFPPLPLSPPTKPHRSQAAKVGPFKFLRVLPKGTFGKTLIAQDHGTGRVLCTRVFEKGKMRSDANFQAALLTELLCYKHIAAQAASRTFIMELHGVLQDEENVIFAMPLMRCDLLGAIQGRGERNRVRRWVAQVALGIDALHSMGIIHRDIKPENVLLDAQTDTARIADFNAAYLHPGNAPLENGAVYTREYIGSKPYLAPEVARRDWYGKMVDWWALGCMMFDLVAGEVLFPSETQRNKYIKWDTEKKGTSYLRWATELSREEEAVMLGLLHLKPNSRFQIEQLQRQRYFLDEKGNNVFHVFREQMHRPPPVSTRPVEEKVLEVSPVLKDVPICYAIARSLPTGAEGPHEFRDFAWVNPRGLWGSS